MRKILGLLLSFLIITNFAFATRWEGVDDYEQWSPNWEINAQTNAEVPVFKITTKGKIGGLGTCGIQATAFYRLAMMLNKDTLKDIIDNWQNLAFVAVLYTVGTYFPIVKEAMVGAEMLANTIAKLKNLNCQSAMNVMNSYFKRTSSLVRACVLNKLGQNVNPWDLDEGKVEEILKEAGATEGQIENAYYYCMNNASLTDSFSLNTPEMKKWLKLKNLRRWITCNYVDKLGMEDLGDKYSLKYTLIHGGDAKTMAQVGLLAITPEWIVTQNDKEKILTPKNIEVDGIPVTMEYLYQLIKRTVDDDFKELREKAEGGNSDEYYSKVKSMNTKFFIKHEDVLPYFDYYYLLIQAIKKAENVGNYALVSRLKANLKAYETQFKHQYYLLKKQSIEKKMIELYKKAEARKSAMQVAGDSIDPCGDIDNDKEESNTSSGESK